MFDASVVTVGEETKSRCDLHNPNPELKQKCLSGGKGGNGTGKQRLGWRVELANEINRGGSQKDC